MPTTETETEASSQYAPFTPFQDSYAFEAEPSTLKFLEALDSTPIATPFASEYEGVETRTAESAELRDLLFELHDQEFDEVLAEMAGEMWEAAAERAEPFGEVDGGASAERFLRELTDPVREAAESMLENVAQTVSENDLATMTEAEVDEIFERIEPRDTGFEPYFENFLGKLLNKAKAITKKAVDIAKKGIALVPGLGALLEKLKALVRPLLENVLKTAIDKLPPALRSPARQLAQRVLGGKVGEVALEAEEEEEGFPGAPAAPDIGAAQRQFDIQAAALLFAADETEQEVIVNEAAFAGEGEVGAGVAELHEARAKLVEQLESGVPPEQAMEQFLPAVMAVLPVARTAIGIVGRPRVVSTLAKILAGFVSRYIPKEAATPLSRAIVDAGLRMLSLEAPVEGEAGDPRLALETIGQTVEDTVRRVAELGEEAFEEPALLEASVAEAFQRAAAENFPPQSIVPELHEAPLRAIWALMPVGRGRKYYKKYSHVFDVEITPQTAASLSTFGGIRLDAFLRDRLGVAPPVRAKVHLYQAISGTTLKRIAKLERNVPGLGRAPHGDLLLHPLDVAAAGTLLHHPKLGRDMPGASRSSRRSIALGQRFCYLEIPGARPIAVARHDGAGTVVRKASDVNVTLDFPRDEFRVFLYLSEPDAQEIAAKIRNRDLTSVLLLAKRIYGPGLRVALGGDVERHVKVLSEAVSQEEIFGSPVKKLADGIRQRLARRLSDWVGKAIAEYMKAGAGELVAATEEPVDGVSVVVHLKSPPGAPLLRKLLSGEAVGSDALRDLGSLFGGQPQLSVKTVAGFRRG